MEERHPISVTTVLSVHVCVAADCKKLYILRALLAFGRNVPVKFKSRRRHKNNDKLNGNLHVVEVLCLRDYVLRFPPPDLCIEGKI